MTDIELEEGRHYGVGMTGTGTEHTTLVISTAYDTNAAGDSNHTQTVYACVDCGLVSDDTRRFSVEDCEREDNPIPKTLREQLATGEGL